MTTGNANSVPPDYLLWIESSQGRNSGVNFFSKSPAIIIHNYNHNIIIDYG